MLNEMGLSVEQDGYIFNYDGNVQLQLNGYKIKASIDHRDIKYAGQGEVVLDPLTNIKLVTALLGYYLNQKISDGLEFVSYYQEEKIDSKNNKMTALTIKYDNFLSRTTKFYYNPCLKFINLIFLIENQMVDLSNFDSLLEPSKRRY
jgi:hypothetical protein